MLFNILYIIWINSWRTLRLIQSPCSRTSWNKGNNNKKIFLLFLPHLPGVGGSAKLSGTWKKGNDYKIIRETPSISNSSSVFVLPLPPPHTHSSASSLQLSGLKKWAALQKEVVGFFSPGITAPCTKVDLHTHGSKVWEEKALQAGNAHLVNKTDEAQFETPMAAASRPRSEEMGHASGLVSDPLNTLSLWNTRDLVLNINAINMGWKCLLWNLLLIFWHNVGAESRE